MEFIEDAKRKFHKLWSVRLSLLSAVASSAEVGVNLYTTGTAPKLVILAAIVSFGAAIARVISQPKLAKK